MDGLFSALSIVFRVVWFILQVIWGAISLVFTARDWLELLRLPFQRKAAAASHLGSAPESPHMTDIALPPERPLEEDNHERT